MIQYKYYVKSDVSNAANIAIKNRLYVSGWSLSRVLDLLRDHPNSPLTTNSIIVLAYMNSTPIGICLFLFHEENKYESQIFVRKAYRRSGIGTYMFREALHNIDQNNSIIYSNFGIQNSGMFFRKIKRTFPITMFYDGYLLETIDIN